MIEGIALQVWQALQSLADARRAGIQVSIQLRARLERADLQENLGVPVPVIPGRPDGGIKLDRSDQFLIPVPVQRAEPGMPEDGSAPVNHQGIIPGSRLGCLRCTLLPRGERGSVSDARESRLQAAALRDKSQAPVAAVDLPCPVGPLDHMEGNRAGLHGHAAATAADLPPAVSRDAGQATVPGKPGGGRGRRWLTTPVRYQRQRES